MIVEDPDAPDPASPHRKTYVHWVIYRLSPETRTLPEGATPSGGDGENDFGRVGYGGPCPPTGRHRYIFKVFALDTALDLGKPHAGDLYRAMNGHVLAAGKLVGTYEKARSPKT